MPVGKLNRREALQAFTFLSAFAAAVKLPSAHAARNPFADIPFNPSEDRKIGIIGAGVAGLSAAYVAARAGFKVTVMEADSRYGGRSLTVRPHDDDYRERWFSKYNPYKLFPAMYQSGYQERPDSPDNTPQIANFTLNKWPGTDEYVELFLNAGPGRIPSNHTVLLDLCQEIGVRLEPYIFLSESNLLWSETYEGTQPVAWREINYSLIGELSSQVLAAVNDGLVLQGYDQAQVKNMLTELGDLTNGKFEGSSTVGYAVNPGGWRTNWQVNQPVSMKEILSSGFVGSGDAEQSAGSFLFNSNHITWQPTLMQPIGGMDRIWQQLLLQEVPDTAVDEENLPPWQIEQMHRRDTDGPKAIRGKRFIGDLVALSTQVKQFTTDDFTLVKTLSADPDGRVWDRPLSFNKLIGTAAPALFSERTTVQLSGSEHTSFTIPSSMLISNDLDDDFKEALAAVQMTAAIKVGFQGKYRFWEEEDQIFGGISWTTMLSSQIWYPSEDFNAPTGILTAAFNRGDGGYEFGLKDQAQRIQAALDGGETLHADYAEKVYKDAGVTIAWQYMPGQVAGWPAEAYQSQTDVYCAITNLPQSNGNVFFAGDAYSQAPGWQEGAVASARLAIHAIVSGLSSTDPALYPTGSTMQCNG